MQCVDCGRQFSATRVVCKKYPNGIPEEIIYDEEECKHKVTEWREIDEQTTGDSGEDTKTAGT